jgi:hypothetical protein
VKLLQLVKHVMVVINTIFQEIRVRFVLTGLFLMDMHVNLVQQVV